MRENWFQQLLQAKIVLVVSRNNKPCLEENYIHKLWFYVASLISCAPIGWELCEAENGPMRGECWVRVLAVDREQLQVAAGEWGGAAPSVELGAWSEPGNNQTRLTKQKLFQLPKRSQNERITNKCWIQCSCWEIQSVMNFNWFD